MALDPNDLLIFARVAEAGSFTAGAARLNLPKSTVSRRINMLEAQLGEKLLQRTTRQVVLTEMGERILGPALKIERELDEATAVADYRRVTPSGRLRVSVPGDFASISIAPMLAEFAIAFPHVQLEVDLSPQFVDLIADGYDLAIRMGAIVQDSQLTARHLADLSIGLYASPHYLVKSGEPKTPENLRDHAMLVLMRGGTRTPWTLQAGERSFAIDWTELKSERASANSYELLIRMACLGAGIAAMPDIYAAVHVQAGALVPVLPQWKQAQVAVWAVFPGRQLMPRKTRVFLDAIIGALRAQPVA